jgi:polyisoprenoid-binding protein YceI
MRTSLAFLAALALVACAEDLSEGRTHAAVLDLPSDTMGTELDATGVERILVVDASQSELGLIGAKVTKQHPIRIGEYSATVAVTPEGLVTGVQFEVMVASIEADHPKLTAHLKTEDFLWVDKYPTAEFQSVEVERGADVADMTHTVTGDLTIRGRTKRISFPASIAVTEGGVEASTEFVIDRQDFGVAYPGRPDDLVQDSVVMQIHLVAPEVHVGKR